MNCPAPVACVDKTGADRRSAAVSGRTRHFHLALSGTECQYAEHGAKL
jgi:hypothetical protein